jgi:SAM-dependent methyltransferase/uncharacterized membrane protein YbhN (UPF0104 family)
MISRRLLRIGVGLFLIGIAIVGLWIYLVGGSEFLTALLRMRPAFIIPLAGVTALCLFIRFIRWQFLLRQVGVRVPIRLSFGIYLASLVGIATPAYVGELLRGVLMRRRFGTPLRITSTVFVAERLFDVAALGAIGVLTVGNWWMRLVMILFILAAILVGVAARIFGQRLGVPAVVLSQLGRWQTVVKAFGLSVGAWISAALLVNFATLSLGIGVPFASGIGIFSSSTLLGGLTLMPAGIGSTGSLMILEFQALGLPLIDSVVVVTLVRLFSVGASLAVSAVLLTLELRNIRKQSLQESEIHFDEIADAYGEQFLAHVWNYLLDRRIGFLTSALPDSPAEAGIGLDLGCGLGQQMLAMGRNGHRTVGVDAARNLLSRAHAMGASVAAGDALALPFRDATFGYVYTVGVLHHLADEGSQRAACQEVLRVLKPGGLFIVQETNPRNPLFRFYMGYVFPMLRRIDEGTETWIQPRQWEGVEGMRLVRLQYFTFIPDFIPQALMRPLVVAERALERSSLRGYSVHYMAVYQKISAESAATDGNLEAERRGNRPDLVAVAQMASVPVGDVPT